MNAATGPTKAGVKYRGSKLLVEGAFHHYFPTEDPAVASKVADK